MVAEKTDRKNGRRLFGKLKRTLSTLGKELASRGQRLRWNVQRRRVEIVNR
ncbi:MAG: hypothetical protein IPL99_08910 [Candidatus Competibacteraceae bacterium]|nr:hypothetical protein [Candidatus Competibacteraceae bacterium]